jgi:DNA-binding response OmpR family regulator
VEDSRADASLVREALTEHHVEAELIIVTDGENAINLIEEIDGTSAGCPDLVILDLNLPKKSGREVLQAMRLSRVCRQANVIVLSSSDAKQDVDEAHQLGVTKYIRKPLRLDEFLKLGATFKEMLRGGPSQ